MNKDIQLTDTEVQILFLIRSLKLFDKLEIKYVKQGELMWQKTESHVGKFNVEINQKSVDTVKKVEKD